MTIDSITLRLISLLIPGIIAFGIVVTLAPQRRRTNFTMLLQIFMYGVGSYAVYYLFANSVPAAWLSYLSVESQPLIFSQEISDLRQNLSFREIVLASICAVLLGLSVTVNVNYSILLRLMEKLKVTNRYGDVDVWSYTMNLPLDAWVTVHDYKRGVVYDGYVEAFSPGGANREILMSRVQVYDADSGEETDRVPTMYLAFEDNDVSVEFRNVAFDDWSHISVEVENANGSSN